MDIGREVRKRRRCQRVKSKKLRFRSWGGRIKQRPETLSDFESENDENEGFQNQLLEETETGDSEVNNNREEEKQEEAAEEEKDSEGEDQENDIHQRPGPHPFSPWLSIPPGHVPQTSPVSYGGDTPRRSLSPSSDHASIEFLDDQSRSSHSTTGDIRSDHERHLDVAPETFHNDDPSSPSSYASDDPDYFEDTSLLELAREWILTQLGRNCSNSVSDDLFQFAWDNAATFVRLKDLHKGKTNILPELRRKVISDCLPPIKMDYVFLDNSLPQEVRDDNPVHVYNCLQFPRKKYSTDKYELLSQVTRVKVGCGRQ